MKKGMERVRKDVPVQNIQQGCSSTKYSFSKDISVQNIQPERIFK
jgi:hypothetical protein